jgi:Tir chaperone protein (CesT) family
VIAVEKETMSLEELINATCQDASAAERQTILRTGGLLVNGIPFALVPGATGTGDEDSLYVYCDFGCLPRDQTVAVLKRILEINIFLYGRETPSFVFNPSTEHILLACRMDRSGITAQRFMQSLREMSSYAHQWQATHFLSDEEIDSPPHFGVAATNVASTGPMSSARAK